MRLTAVVIISCLLLAVMLPAACGPQDGAVLVRVNGLPVTEGDLVRELYMREGARLLLEMIDTRLIFQAAERENIHIDEKELQLKFEQVVARVGSEADLQERLKATRMTMEELREAVRADALLDKMALATIKPTDAEIEHYYTTRAEEFAHGRQFRARLMLFADRANAEAVRSALDDPEADFAGLAEAFSEDPATRAAGGDTGFFGPDDYAEPISEMAARLNEGEISPVFAVPDGYCILQMVEKRDAGVQPLEAVRDSIVARIGMEQLDDARAQWLRVARKGAQLHINDEILQNAVRRLIEINAPYEPTELVPGLPRAPR